MAEKARRPLPIPNRDTEPFWEGCVKGELRLQRCLSCHAYRHPPSPICHLCWSPEHEWAPASGRGAVYSFVIVHHAFHGWNDELPYVVAIIALEEGPHIVSNVVDVPIDSVQIGMAVSVFFDPASEEIVLPKFRPSGS